MGLLLGYGIKDLDHTTLFRCTSQNFNQWYSLYYLKYFKNFQKPNFVEIL